MSSNARLPNPAYFPFASVDVRVPTLGKFKEEEIATAGATIRIVKTANQITPAAAVNPIVSQSYPTDLAATLQYAQGFGDIALRKFAREHIQVLIITLTSLM